MTPCSNEWRKSDNVDFLPPHEKTCVAGFHAYSQRVSVAPGQALDIRVSGSGAVDAEVVRLGTGKIPRTRSEPAAARLVAELGQKHVEQQTVCRGSYVYVAQPFALRPPLAVELWCRPLAKGRLAGLMCRDSLRLSVAEDDRLVLEIKGKNGWVRLIGPVLEPKHWYHVVGQCDQRAIQLFLDGRQVAKSDFNGEVAADATPLRLGALTNATGEAVQIFTGDICGPSLYSATLPDREIVHHWHDQLTEPGPNCVGHWKFDALAGPPFRDVSQTGAHGQGVNYPLRMMPGPRMNQEQSWPEYDPTADPSFGHAVRLMADQLVDCRWPETFSWQVPPDQASGQYAVRLRNDKGDVRFVPFIVRPVKPTARLMCLSTTNTRIAYNYRPFDNLDLDYGAYHPHPAYPMRGHLLGQRRPSTGPGYVVTVVNLELPFYHWLDEQGIAYDVYSEWDLEAEPALLDHYSVVAWAGHSEYWTASRFENLQRFRRRGGHILSLSGNTCFWRVSIDDRNGVVEVRKHEDAASVGHGGDVDPMLHNGHWHQIDHMPGTTMHACGWPAFQLGLGMTGCWPSPCEIDGRSAGYEVVAPEHPLFHGPRTIPTTAPLARGAAGYEMDLSLRSIIDHFGPVRRTYIAPKDKSDDLSLDACLKNGPKVLARARLPNVNIFDYNLKRAMGEGWSEMHLWEQPREGIVFAAGSCMAPFGLQDDENFSNFMLNLLGRMNLKPGPTSK